MKYEIHYTINGHEDCYVIESKTIKELFEINEREMKKRNLDMKKNNCWSREL